jgi:hypothetical protein
VTARSGATPPAPALGGRARLVGIGVVACGAVLGVLGAGALFFSGRAAPPTVQSMPVSVSASEPPAPPPVPVVAPASPTATAAVTAEPTAAPAPATSATVSRRAVDGASRAPPASSKPTPGKKPASNGFDPTSPF